MIAGEPGLCLVYLAWTPYGVEPAERFLRSYREHSAGTGHRLVVTLAGPEGDREPWRDAFSAVEHETIEVGEGVDLGHYRKTVERVTADRYCFLNTASVVLAEGWLGHLERALLGPGVGMVATTGSYESPNSVRPGPLRRRRPGYESFPNPHLRTNGFALERDFLLSLDWPVSVSREESLKLESGCQSLTSQVRDRGLETLVVGRDGVGYPAERWFESATFRSGGQANLLLADNRTRHYQDGGSLTRLGLSLLAWRRWG